MGKSTVTLANARKLAQLHIEHRLVSEIANKMHHREPLWAVYADARTLIISEIEELQSKWIAENKNA